MPTSFASWVLPLLNVKTLLQAIIVCIPKKGNIALFSENIPGGMNIKEINRQIQGGKIHIKAFPGG